MTKQDPDTLSSIVITFRLGNRNPVERAALAYLQECAQAGEDKRQVIARALAAAAENDYKSQQLAAQNESIREQLQELIARIQAGSFSVRRDADPAGGVGREVDPSLAEHLKKVVGTIRRAGDMGD